MSTLKFYHSPVSPPSRFVKAILTLGNIPHELIIIDLLKQENKTEEYGKINPNKTVPALVDGDVKLWESHAIGKYLCDKYASNVPAHWYPRNDPAARCQVDQWLDWRSNTLVPSFGEVYRPKILGIKLHEDEKVHEALYEAANKKLQAALDRLEAHLAEGNRFIAGGSEPTIADISLLVAFLSATLVAPVEECFGNRPHLTKWNAETPKVIPHWDEAHALFYVIRNARREQKQ